MRILLVKLSSMGDVIHNLPVMSDIKKAFPEAIIDWVTEAPYAGLVMQHPSVSQVLSVHLRALKKQWWQPAQWSQLTNDRMALAINEYDAVIDTQGLIKSALVSTWAHGERFGMASDSAREPWAAKFYDRTFSVEKNLHAVTRNRQLAAAALGYTLDDDAEKVDYGLEGTPSQTPRPAWLSSDSHHPYIVLLHATSRPDKQWPQDCWVTLGQQLQRLGYVLVLPFGNAAEKETSELLAKKLAHPLHPLRPIVPPPSSLTEAATMLHGAAGVIGVDTGLAHLAVALGRPTVGIYITTTPNLTGLFGAKSAINLGGGSKDHPKNPSTGAVFEAILPYLARPTS